MDLTRLRLMALTAVRQRSRHREFRFRFYRRRRGLVRVEIRARRGAFAAEVGLRPGTADARCFQQIFLDEAYDLRPLRRWPELWGAYEALLASGGQPLILDGGANIGLASLYLARQWPGSRIVAVEPEVGNFARLSAHAAQEVGATVEPLQAALAGADGVRGIVNPRASTAAFRTGPAGGEKGVPAYSIPTLLARYANQVPWLAKIDVEGAERELFGEGAAWVDRFPILIVEPHDWMFPGEGAAQPLLRALAARDRDFLVRGESVVSVARHIDFHA